MNGDTKDFCVDKRLKGKVAIITGGARGIGASTAKLFLHHGAKVIIADVQDQLGLSFCKSLNSQDISYTHCNVTNDFDVENVVNLAMSKYGRLDIMYSNAGITGKNEPSILSTNNQGFKNVLDVNLYGAFSCAKHASRVMVPRKTGVILFTASIASVTSGITSHSYAASKIGIVGLARNLSVELGKHGIRVNCISPGSVPTALLRDALGGIERNKLEKVSEASTVLKGVVIKEDDVANAALFLASDEARVITGHNLLVDGGYTTTNNAFFVALRNRL